MSSEEKPKKKSKKDVKTIIFNALKTFIGGIIVVLVYLFLNANTVYLIKNASDKVINSFFPTKCSAAPYGTKQSSPCKDYETIVREVQYGGEYSVKSEVSNQEIKEKVAGTSENVKWPYSWFTNNPDNAGRNYLNWYLGSLSYTQIKMNTLIKDVIQNKYLSKIPNDILLVLTILIVGILLFIIPIYTYICFTYKQIISGFNHGTGAFIIMFFTWFLMAIFNLIVAKIDMLIAMFKLLIYPSFFEGRSKWPEIGKIISQQSVLLGYIIGFIFITVLLDLPLNEDYALPVKLIPLAFYLVIVTVHLISYIYRVVKSL